MKSAFKILKFTFLAALIVAMILGYLFFRVWQKNERPTIVESSWDESEVLLGHDRTLSITVRAPWHREITSARPVSHPDFLAPVFGQASFTRGELDFTGHRLWYFSIPMVTTNTKSLEGKSITIPIKSTRRVSPNSVTVILPKLTIQSPLSIPPEPENSEEFLKSEAPPVAAVKKAPVPEKKSYLWAWLLAAIVPIVIIGYYLRRKAIFDATPPWERALTKLDQLSSDDESIVFFSKLTDILKQYTSERYRVGARTKTSSEFIQSLKKLPEFPDEFLEKLPPLARLADGVKFAGLSAEKSDASQSLGLVRSYVIATTPEPTTDSSDA